MDFTIWTNFLLQTLLIASASTLVFGALVGYALASAAKLRLWSSIALGALVPVGGVLTLSAIALARRNNVAKAGETQRQHATTLHAERWLLFGFAFISAALICAMFLGWFNVSLPYLRIGDIGAWGTPLGAAVVASIAATAAAWLLSLRMPSRISAILLAWFGSWWLFLSGIFLAVQAPAGELARAFGGVQYTLGDVLSLLHVGTKTAMLTLPDGVDPHALGLESTTVDLASINLGASIPDIRFDVGPGWWAMLAFAVGSLTMSAAIIRQHRKVASGAGFPPVSSPTAFQADNKSMTPTARTPESSPWSRFTSHQP
ncbi:hypothetical protein [Arthrobacter bambusae]|uniref:ABC transporter permease n=1 Tax=Arthrobacter bambusae TaxID=1338426 RepID=A0AAW8D9R0_9MICC|nr:hypothetical protein [Arthrobacter bambusae]MDP9905651.1 hypothetical protein [Arthrobacter bambusae]MDQ0127267.1 hypothetical protein [Arthrobacter bambusae]MDQ0178609.1 hypothetical protein [Arthrobacter bambusae]